ncbi:MAG: hypothetical protein K0R61_7 [Microvirga sp.]|jgi:hypothetical protein|nr:hypothetical protein [Microvirga sp.]MDF2969557.1 hypothetical protein [Microvirga sp.]
MKTLALTADRLRQVLHYDPDTGLFTRLFGKGRGKPTRGTLHHTGYLFIGVDGVTHLAHRLAWLYVTGEHPPEDVEHRDLDKANNRFANLRECNDSTNQANTKPRPGNTSGYKGVCWNKKSNKWQAGIKKDGKSHHLGLFDCPVAAHLAYATAADRIHGEYARAA